MANLKWKGLLFLVLMAALTQLFCLAATDPRDVDALRNLYFSLNSPPLDGWIPLGGDPCGDHWQGVLCVFTNVTQLMLNGSNLGGTLGDSLDFPSILQINFSNNQIGGSIPSVLPSTLTNLSLSKNAITGGIPDAFERMTVLQELDLSDNNLSGPLPPSLGNILALCSLDLSNNNLSGPLPSSMANMLLLNSLYLQDNKLTGLLDVLEGLPLLNLDIENNLFSGPIPVQLLSIPNFRKEGNPFNTSIIPSPPPPLALPPSVAAPPYAVYAPQEQPHRPSVPSALGAPESGKQQQFVRSKMFIWIVAAGIVLAMILGVCILMSTCCKKRQVKGDAEAPHAYQRKMGKPSKKFSLEPENQMEKVLEESNVKLRDWHVLNNIRLEAHPKPQDEQEMYLRKMAACSKQTTFLDTILDTNVKGMDVTPLPSATLPPQRISSSSSLGVFTIAALQQYTSSFAEENLVGEGMLGSVYRAELPDGRLLAVKKLKSTSSRQHTDEEFHQLISSISKIRHANILEIVGYCNEYGQRLLIYEYCIIGSLHDALHVDDETHKKLTWNARIRVALGAARALQYLHETCQPAIVHQNFTSANILLDDKLVARVSDCGLAPLMSSNSDGISRCVPGAQGYNAPELELGSYTCKSDIYSFGVVMLELLTGRKSYDRSQSRGAQSLVRWAIPRLHDIDALSRMVDPSLKGLCPVKSLSCFADIISRCVQWEPEFRPRISEVVQDLLHMV